MTFGHWEIDLISPSIILSRNENRFRGCLVVEKLDAQNSIEEKFGRVERCCPIIIRSSFRSIFEVNVEVMIKLLILRQNQPPTTSI